MRKGSHTQYDIQYHIAWATKYRYGVLSGKVVQRLRVLLMQGCVARGITIIRGNITKNHVHLLVSCPPQVAPAKIVQYLKGRSSKILQEEFNALKRKYWGTAFVESRIFLRKCCRNSNTRNNKSIYRSTN